MADLPLALIRDHLAPLLHPESLWSYLWQPEDTQRVSDVLDEAYGHKVGSALWQIDWLSGPLFDFGDDHPDEAVAYGKAWVIGIRPGGKHPRESNSTFRALWISPRTKPRVWSPANARFVTLKAWQAADKKAKEVSWPRRLAEAEAELRAKHPELFHGKPAMGGA